MAKGIGNGMPLAAVATTKKVADVLANKAHFNTYGGNPLAVTSGREVLKIIEEENLPLNAEKLGELFLKRLKEMEKKY